MNLPRSTDCQRWCFNALPFAAGSVLAAVLSGCSGSTPEGAVICKCRVTIQGEAVHNVRVVLARTAGGQTLAVLEGVCDGSGSVPLRLSVGAELPDESQIELRAAIESLGDWQVATPWCSVEKTPLTVVWSPSVQDLEIELPQRAIREL